MRQAEAPLIPGDKASREVVRHDPAQAINPTLRQAKSNAEASVQRPAPRRRGPFPCPSLREFSGRPGELARYLGMAQAVGRRIIRLLLPLALLVPGGRA